MRCLRGSDDQTTMKSILVGVSALLFSFPAFAVTRSVGPGQPYATPCQALTAAQNGDVVEIAAGLYTGDVCAITANNLTIRGVGGRARLDAAGLYAWGKGIWVVAGDNTIIENIEFFGARVPDRNGAGIRLDTGNLTVRNCFFHDNENGILGGAYGFVLIEHSEFANNGYGDGYSHNIYLNAGVAQFTLRYSYSHHARNGHLVKSRAAVNYILYNRLTQESGTGSYELDLPNAGHSYVIGNVLQQGETTQNRGMLSYGMEALSATTPNQLYAVNNTFVSTRSAGATFVQVGASVPLPAVVRNNVFSGSGILMTQASALLAGNVSSGDIGFVNPLSYDYRITAASAALNAGVDPGTGGSYPLRPAMQYYHPLCGESRADVGLIDAGAFEYGLITGTPVCAGVVPPPPVTPVLSALSLSASQVTGGAAVTGTVTLSAAAGASGTVVSLSSSAPAVAAVPASVTVPAGQTSATFPITTGAVAASTTAAIQATLDGKTLSASLTVNPPPAAARLLSLAISPSKTSPGGKVKATLRLTAPAPAGGLVASVASSSAGVSVPASVTVPQGSASVSFQANVSATAAAQTVTLTATAVNSVSAQFDVTRTGRAAQ